MKHAPLLWLTWLTLLSVACDNRVFLLIPVSGVPTGSAALQVIATRANSAATNQPVIDLSDLGQNTSFTFGLEYPTGTSGAVTVAAVTRGPDSCLGSVGDLSTSLSGADTYAPLMLNAVSVKECSQLLPLLLSAVPPQASIGDTVELLGFGFNPQVAVSIDGHSVAQLQWLSPARLSVVVPALATDKGLVDVTITNSDLTQARSSSLLTLQ